MQQGVFRAFLVTKGRRTGKSHSVQLRAVSYHDMIYFSRRNENSDWLKNALVNNCVEVKFEGQTLDGIASMVTDDALAKKISQLKYPGEERASEVRIVLQVKLTN